MREISCHTFAAPAVILALDQSLNDCFVLEVKQKASLSVLSLLGAVEGLVQSARCSSRQMLGS